MRPVGFFIYGSNSLALAELVGVGRVKIIAELGEVTPDDLQTHIDALTKAKADLLSGRFPIKKE